ncbi:DUF2157 domain-containing protein [Ammoniphilus resinae]|uniref:Membrane protein n=1 Tax=Ammoniphilus resinae TaxID=861532 RepID=A0ABS4GME6_9BACL|nr:DUF2157 domain-containing protein [Ammoniphilus resinae]MBP1931424.1 putative membrane protein [Ammoniphilus resinae]
MSQKWLRREGLEWVDKEIITHEQYEKILQLYPEQHRMISFLPIFASILVGLSLLTFVASNWDGMSQITRFVILLITMLGFYSAGFTLYRKGHPWVGQGLLGLGVVTFGASMILIGQMFHLIAYDARVFAIWALAGLGMLYLYRRNFFYFITAVILFTGQVYAMVSFGEASWLILVLTLFGLGIYAWSTLHSLVGWLLSFLLGIQIVFLIFSNDIAWSWLSIIPIGFYAVGLLLEKRSVAGGFLFWSHTFGVIFASVMVFAQSDVRDHTDFLANPIAYMILFLGLLILAVYKSGWEKGKLVPVVLFLPMFYLPFGDLLYLLILFVFSLLLIYYGDQEEHRWKSKMGVILFMYSCFLGYIQLAWDFLDKSLFFLLGGIMLFVIHWLLRRRDRWMTKGGE